MVLTGSSVLCFKLILLLLFCSISKICAEHSNKQSEFDRKQSLVSQNNGEEYHVDCSTLLPGQFLCLDLNIDEETQQPKDCHPELLVANVTCQAAPGLICHETLNSSFTSTIPCKPTNGYQFETALLLAVFFGMFGLDRFYLGYYAIGLAKLCTLGFLFFGQLVDVVLIATQTLKPADGSYYVISYYGAAINILGTTNETFKMPQPDWNVRTDL